jgi:hypothetical protein
MAQFPFKEADVIALAKSVMAGLTANPAVFPAPTVDLAVAQGQIDAYNQARAAMIEANAIKQMATRTKQDAYNTVKDSLKKQLRYAENTASFDDNKLNMLGWAAKREKTSTLPGQVRNLRVLEQGTDYVVLDWMSPADGQRPGVYQIMRRDERQTETWIDAGVSIATKIKLFDQPRHIDMEYKVVAVTRTGQGPESNTVAVVL